MLLGLHFLEGIEMKLNRILLAVGMTLAVSATYAAPVVVADPALIPQAQRADFEGFDGLLSGGPVLVAPGVTFTGDADSEVGAFIADLGANGLWGAGNKFVASTAPGTLTFTFVGLTSTVTALVNHHASGFGQGSVTVSVYGAGNNLLESFTHTAVTGDTSLNAGFYLGFARANADIRAISFSGQAVVVDNLSFTTPVPEAGSVSMVLAGLATVGLVAYRRRRG
jgi:hypothetical protein